jgi:hypothetical protein
MPLNPEALTTLTVMKNHLDIRADDTSQDTRLEFMINAASTLIERYCGRRFALQEYVQICDGKGSDSLVLENYPVTSVSSVHVDSDRDFSGTPEDPTSYALVSGFVLRKNTGVWLAGRGAIRVAYSSGYATIPADVSYACTIIAEDMFRMRNDRRVGRQSQGKQGEQIHFINQWPPQALAILDAYKRMPSFSGPSVEFS